MTKVIRILLMFMLSTQLCSALDAQDGDRFERAGQAYTQMHYQDAYNLYQEINSPTSVVYFNMGNCAFKLGYTGRALWHWRQAEERWGILHREDLRENLELAREKLGHEAVKKTLIQSGRGLIKTILNIASAIPLILVQIQFLLFWTLLFVFVRSLLKKKMRFLVLLLGVGVFINGGLLIYRQIRAMDVHAIVIDVKALVYAGPSTTYQQVGTLIEGQEVFVDRQRQDFYKIRAKDQFGWVERKALGII